MARCFTCGRMLTNEESVALGQGAKCRHKAKKAGTVSKRQLHWKKRIERTSQFARGLPFDIGSTKYNIIENKWTDGKHFYDKKQLEKWLEETGGIIRKEEVVDRIFILLKNGIPLETINELLDNTED